MTLINAETMKKKLARWSTGLVAAAAVMCLTGRVYADPPVSISPPVSAGDYQQVDGDPVNTSADSVFRWSEIPQNQEVPVTRAIFDRAGYQIYDTVGETIVVPFTNNNLYVMKFGLSTNGHMYFVNDGSAPILYVPQDSYLENATASGARWYPFSHDYRPASPVFLGVAPSWTAFVDMGWYPDMYYYGGYWCNDPFISGGIFLPEVGLFFVIGGHHYYGWNGYHDYYYRHPAPYRVGYYHRDVYRFANGPHGQFRGFGGGGRVAGRPGGPRGFGGGRTFRGTGHPYSIARGTGGPRGSGGFGGNSGSHEFRGPGSNGGRTFGGRTFGGGQSSGGGSHVFRGGQSGIGGRTFGGGDHTFGGSHSSGDSNRSFGGSHSSGGSNRSFGGGRDSGGDHSFGGGSGSHDSDNHSSGGGDHSFGGGHDSGGGGGRSFGGGGGGNDHHH